MAVSKDKKDLKKAYSGSTDSKKASQKSTGAKKTSPSGKDNTIKKSLTIEESLTKLDKILEKMEDEETGLEESFKLYEEGLGIVKQVNNSIDTVEKKITILSDEKELPLAEDEDG